MASSQQGNQLQRTSSTAWLGGDEGGATIGNAAKRTSKSKHNNKLEAYNRATAVDAFGDSRQLGAPTAAAPPPAPPGMPLTSLVPPPPPSRPCPSNVAAASPIDPNDNHAQWATVQRLWTAPSNVDATAIPPTVDATTAPPNVDAAQADASGTARRLHILLPFHPTRNANMCTFV
jgi:hypothetical protein